MKTFKPTSDPKFEEPSSIEFQNRTFHLSGKFNGVTKEKFSESIVELGGKCRGFGKSKHLNIEETDYFILADNGLIGGKPHGSKAIAIQKYNDKRNGRHVPIIKESVCIKLLNEYRFKMKLK